MAQLIGAGKVQDLTVVRKSRARSEAPNLTALAAAKFVERHGCEALRILDERAALAAELGHRVAAETWRGMAEVAVRLLRGERDAPAIPPQLARRLPRVWLR
jgi:hypothetical protein